MWKFTFCPHFRVCSVTFLLIIAEILYFMAEAAYSKVVDGHFNKYNFLGAMLSTEQTFGMRMPYAIRHRGHIHRLFLPFLMHHNFGHLFIACMI
jgi:membrane associated rhomboid family serine protease